MSTKKTAAGGQTLIEGALVLTMGMAIVKIIGAIYRMPIAITLGGSGMGYFGNAYALYNPVYVLAAAGFPSVLARLVAESMATGRYRDVREIQKVAQRVFFVTGTVGTCLMVLVGWLMTHYGPWDSWAFPAIAAMSPSVFFCCMMSSYRGYTEGMRNMTPTAVSQVIEALGKLVIGLAAAVGVVRYGEHAALAAGLPHGWESGLKGAAESLGLAARLVAEPDSVPFVRVFGRQCYTVSDALKASYPWAAAGALMGITLGSVLALVYLMFRMKKLGSGVTKKQFGAAPKPQSRNIILRRLFTIGIPIALGMLALNVTQLIDTFMVQYQIGKLNIPNLFEQYGVLLNPDKSDAEGVANFLFGVYNGYAITIYNLIPYITQTLGVSAIPTLASAWIAKDKPVVKQSINSVLKVSALIAFPAGMGIAALSGPILALLFGGRPESILAEPMLRVLGITVMFGAMAIPVN
ncbi:MAG: oligosaccharide flippase family protein, partial [Oscillospiraceae bacterium]|nr:oligosaccharide flippase family protein [Oscillospiraceae bacterium]